MKEGMAAAQAAVGRLEVASVPIFIAPGPGKTDRRDFARTGGLCPITVKNGGAAVGFGFNEGRPEVTMALRIDEFREDEWRTCDRLPCAFALLAGAPISYLLLQFQSVHLQAPFIVNRDVGDKQRSLAAIGVAEPERSIRLVGLRGDNVRMVKLGVQTSCVWDALRDVVVRAAECPDTDACLAALRRSQTETTPAQMFAEAMRRQLMPREARG